MNFWQAWKGSNGTPWDQVKTGALTTIKGKENTKEERASETGTSDGGWDERENCYQRPRERATDTKTKTKNQDQQESNHQQGTRTISIQKGEREPELWAGLMGNKPHHHHHHHIIKPPKPPKPPRETSRRVDLTRVSGSGGPGLPR